MTPAQLTRKSRNDFRTANKYQEKLILFSFMSSASLFLSFIVIVFAGNPIIMKYAPSSQVTNFVSLFSGAIIIALCTVFILSLVISFKMTNNLLGPVSRIINELDKVIDGSRKKTITARPADELANELLKRINVLVEFYVEKNNTDDKKT